MPAKFLGLALIAAGALLFRGIKLARVRGYTGPRHRRVSRDAHRLRFHFTLGWQALGAVICLAAAYLCLGHAFRH